MSKLGIFTCAALRTLVGVVAWVASGIGETVACIVIIVAMAMSGTMGLLFINDFWDDPGSRRKAAALLLVVVTASWLAIVAGWVPLVLTVYLFSGSTINILIAILSGGTLISIVTTTIVMFGLIGISSTRGIMGIYRDSLDRCRQ